MVFGIPPFPSVSLRFPFLRVRCPWSGPSTTRCGTAGSGCQRRGPAATRAGASLKHRKPSEASLARARSRRRPGSSTPTTKRPKQSSAHLRAADLFPRRKCRNSWRRWTSGSFRRQCRMQRERVRDHLQFFLHVPSGELDRPDLRVHRGNGASAAPYRRWCRR